MKGTTEHRKMLKIILKLETGDVPEVLKDGTLREKRQESQAKSARS